MPNNLELLESKILQAVEELQILRKENERLKSTCETLKSQIALTSGDNRKTQRILAEHEQLRRSHEQATVRVERALQKLNSWSSDMKHVMYVQIMGHEYPIEANSGDDLYVNRLAQFVEERMKEIKEESKVVDSYKLAVMAAMNISDELFRLREHKGSHSETFEIKADELIKMLDTVLVGK